MEIVFLTLRYVVKFIIRVMIGYYMKESESNKIILYIHYKCELMWTVFLTVHFSDKTPEILCQQM